MPAASDDAVDTNGPAAGRGGGGRFVSEGGRTKSGPYAATESSASADDELQAVIAGHVSRGSWFLLGAGSLGVLYALFGAVVGAIDPQASLTEGQVVMRGPVGAALGAGWNLVLVGLLPALMVDAGRRCRRLGENAGVGEILEAVHSRNRIWAGSVAVLVLVALRVAIAVLSGAAT